jgi:hypothetical protein
VEVDGLMGQRVNLNTTQGRIDALNVTAHHMFLLAQAEGRDLSLAHKSSTFKPLLSCLYLLLPLKRPREYLR